MIAGKREGEWTYGPCLSYEEFESRSTFLEIDFVFFNSYIDIANIDDPLKLGVNERHRVVLSPDRLTDYRMFVKENTYKIDNSYFYSNMQSGVYYSVENFAINNFIDYQYHNMMVIFLWQDSEVTHYDITVYSFLDMMSTVGGIYEIVFVTLSIWFNYISHKEYLYNIISQITKNESKLNQNNNEDEVIIEQNYPFRNDKIKNSQSINAERGFQKVQNWDKHLHGTIFKDFVRDIKQAPNSSEWVEKHSFSKLKTYHRVK